MPESKLDELHLEYERLLIDEIESLIGLAISHGWQSRNAVKGAKCRAKLKAAGSMIEIPDSDAVTLLSARTAAPSK